MPEHLKGLKCSGVPDVPYVPAFSNRHVPVNNFHLKIGQGQPKAII